MEQYFGIAATIYGIATLLLTAYCLILWIRPFMPDRAKLWLVGGAYAGIMLFFQLLPFYVSPMLGYSAAFLFAFLVMGWLDRGNLAQKLFLVITFFCVRWQAWRIVACIGNELLLLKGNLFPGRGDAFWLAVYVISSAADAALGFALMYGMLKALLWSYGRRREHMNIREFLLLSMPSLSGVFFYGMFRYHSYIYERDTGKSLFDLYGSYDLFLLFYSVFCFVIILVMTYVFRQWKNGQEADRQREAFLRQMQDLKTHIAQVERLYRDMRCMRHDVGNHLVTLEQLYKRGAYGAAKQYADAFQTRLQAFSLDVASGNPVTDAILSAWKKEMEEKDIRFDCGFHYPADTAVDAFDISVILNNAIENAVEAVERDRADSAGRARRVSVSSCRVKHMYIIEVVNSYAGELTVNAPTGLPATTKPGGGHGIGLANIRSVAGKYYGDMEIAKETCEGEPCCVLRVMLQLL